VPEKRFYVALAYSSGIQAGFHVGTWVETLVWIFEEISENTCFPPNPMYWGYMYLLRYH
jgi:hypothetical protein